MSGFLLGISWPLLLIIASVVYRRLRGRTIFAPRLEHPLFAEKWRSGRSRRNFITWIGSANHCLRVTVSQGVLHVTPQFPFNLMFLPEIYGLEISVPGPAIRSVEVIKAGFYYASYSRVTFVRPGGREEQLDLSLKHPQAFAEAIAAIQKAG